MTGPLSAQLLARGDDRAGARSSVEWLRVRGRRRREGHLKVEQARSHSDSRWSAAATTHRTTPGDSRVRTVPVLRIRALRAPRAALLLFLSEDRRVARINVADVSVSGCCQGTAREGPSSSSAESLQIEYASRTARPNTAFHNPTHDCPCTAGVGQVFQDTRNLCPRTTCCLVRCPLGRLGEHSRPFPRARIAAPPAITSSRALHWYPRATPRQTPWRLVDRRRLIDFAGMSVSGLADELATEPTEDSARSPGHRVRSHAHQLLHVAAHHRDVFAALAAFVAADNSLVSYVGTTTSTCTGNRASGVRALLPDTPHAPSIASSSRLVLLRVGLVYVEHGHRTTTIVRTITCCTRCCRRTHAARTRPCRTCSCATWFAQRAACSRAATTPRARSTICVSEHGSVCAVCSIWGGASRWPWCA